MFYFTVGFIDEFLQKTICNIFTFSKIILQEFGLDRNSTYPYLTTACVKSEPATTFDHMVAINDDIKQEYLNQGNENNDDMVHWDSDNDSDDNVSTSSKSVSSLSTISLKTLFSPQCLGKVPRKKRKVKSEDASNSLLAVDYNEDTKSNINSIIDNLVKESINSDSYDSDSILDKNLERKGDRVDLFDSLRDSTDVENTADKQREINEPDGQPNRTDNDDRICSNAGNSDTIDLNEIAINETKEQSTAGTENERINKQLNKNMEVTNDNPTILDENKPESTQKCSDDSKRTENNDVNSELPDSISQNSDNRSSPKNGHIVSNKIVNEESLSIEDNVENRKEQTKLENMDVEQKESKPNSEDKSKVGSSDVEMTEQSEKLTNYIDNEDNTNVDSNSSETGKTIDVNVNQVEPQHHDTDDKVNEQEDSCMVNGETNTNDYSSCATNDKENDNDASYYKTDNKINEDDVSSNLIDDKTNDNSNETNLPFVRNDATNHCNITSFSQTDLNYTEFSFSKDEIKHQDRDTELNSGDSKDSLITENQLFENENVHRLDKFNINHLDEEDKLLMAELDAQIGENSNTAVENSAVIDEKKSVIGENSAISSEDSSVIGENSSVIGENSHVIGENRVNVESVNVGSDYCPIGITNKGFTEQKNENLDRLVEQDDLKSLDLDSISDEEFNFDI